jgi:predicted dehydrogenase
MGWIRVHAACLANFLEAISEGRPAEPGLDQGIYIQHLIERARESARRDSWVDCGR